MNMDRVVKECSSGEKAQILLLRAEGYSIFEISQRIGKSKSTVHLWIRRFSQENNTNTKTRSGRPRCTTIEEDQRVVEHVRNNPFTTHKKIKIDCAINVSNPTVSRRIHSEQLYCRRAATVPDFNERHAEVRVNFARENSHRDWSKVIFSDEKVFYSNANNAKFVYRPRGVRYNKEFVVSKKDSGRRSIAYWGWMSADGPGDLIEGTEKLTAQRYVGLLEEYLLPLAYASENKIVFVQDNSAIHTAKMVIQWFDEQEDFIVKLDWPAKSPDLNPIENLWGAMVRQWDNANMNRDRIGMKEQIQNIWRNQERGFTTNLINSMSRRLNDVVVQNGYYTKY